MKKIIILFFTYFVAYSNSNALIKVDITRGNLDPLPIAVSPLHVDIKSQKLNNVPITIVGDGKQKRSFSDISDCIEALSHIVESDRNLDKEIYNIGPDDNEISINQLAEYVSIITDIGPELIFVPDRPREVKNAFCSSKKIKKEFNYNAKVSLITTLTSMIKWINKRGSQKFEYHLPIEITNREELPCTWKDKLF